MRQAASGDLTSVPRKAACTVKPPRQESDKRNTRVVIRGNHITDPQIDLYASGVAAETLRMATRRLTQVGTDAKVDVLMKVRMAPAKILHAATVWPKERFLGGRLGPHPGLLEFLAVELREVPD